MSEIQNGSKLSRYEKQAAIKVGSALGVIGFYAQILKERVLFSPFNPLTATTDQISQRHSRVWPAQTLYNDALTAGYPEDRIPFLEEGTGKNFKKLYRVGKATPINNPHVRDVQPIYVEVDDNPHTPAKYYFGLQGIKNNEYYTYEQIRASLN